MNRRHFISLTAISGTGAALANCAGPAEHALIRFVPDEALVPGVAQWKPSVCPICGAGCGLQARVMPADVDTTRGAERGVVRAAVAKKLEGASSHPINQGALCARGQAAIQLTYHPDRLAQPLRRSGTRQAGYLEPVTWDQALAELVARLDTLATAGQQRSLACLTAGHRTHRQALFDRFALAFGAPPPVTYQLFGDDVLRQANALSYGQEQLPSVDLENARYVLSFGADFLGTWNSPVAQSMAYGRMRQGRRGVRGSFVQIESRMTPTGASADEWVPVSPGTEGALALGLAHVILKEQLVTTPPGRAAALIDGWAAGLPEFTPEAVSRLTRLPVPRIERLARDFAERRPSLALIGGPPLAQTNGLAAALAVNALNALVARPGQAGGVFFTPQIIRFPSRARGSLETLAQGILSGRQPVEVLLVDDVNPLFTAPPGWKVGDALERVPFIVSFGSFIDETSSLADLVLPDHSFLESWIDALPESGSARPVVSVAPPVMKPLFETRATPDVLLDVARRLGRPLALPWKTFDEMLKSTVGALESDAWTKAVERGGWWSEAAPSKPASDGGAQKGTGPTTLVPAQHDGDPSEYPFHLLPYPSPAFLDGSVAHLPWLQELPDPLTSAMWSSWVEINTRTAERLGIRTGDLVDVTSQVGTIRAPAFVSPAVAPDVAAVPVGQGHRAFTRYASGRGANPVELLAALTISDTNALAWAATRVKIARAGDPDGRLILFAAAGELHERPVDRVR